MLEAELRQQADAGSAEHQWRLSELYRQQKRPARASKYFRRALAQGYHDAILYQLEQWTLAPDEFASFKRAGDLLNQHRDEEHLRGWHWRLGVISGSLTASEDAQLLAAELTAGNPQAQRYAALRCSLAGREAEARWLMLAAATAGDSLAADVLGDVSEHCLPTLSIVEPRLLPAELLREVLHAQPLADAEAETIVSDPCILRRSRWLSPLACRMLALAAAPELRPSLTYEPHTGRQVESPLRTSDSMTFMPWLVDPSVAYIQRCLAEAAERQPGQCEVLGLLRYLPRQAYQLHYDAFAEGGNNASVFEDGGQRTRTALVYLNQSYTGGETRFEHLDLEVKGETGDLLIFDNVDIAGSRHQNSLHAGKPVTTGAKWLLSQWYREAGTLYTRQMGWPVTATGVESA
ncbi:MAG: 2OG-Fe(II) oxygenase [Halioglobus sp.]